MHDGLTRRRGSFRKFERGLAAAVETKLPIKLATRPANVDQGSKALPVGIFGRPNSASPGVAWARR